MIKFWRLEAWVMLATRGEVRTVWEASQCQTKVLCPKGHGQRTSSCTVCRGTGKRSILSVSIGSCKECGGTGQRRCDVCGGSGEVEPARPIAPDGSITGSR